MSKILVTGGVPDAHHVVLTEPKPPRFVLCSYDLYDVDIHTNWQPLPVQRMSCCV